MNFKKILSVIITAAMLLSSVSAFAAIDASQLCEVTVLEDLNVQAVPSYIYDEQTTFDPEAAEAFAEDLTLDFGVNFKALETTPTPEYANFVVDFELSFDKDVTALLAGQYDDFGSKWVSVKTRKNTVDAVAGLTADVDGLDFKAGESIMVMAEGVGDDQFTYAEAVALENFKCGIKLAFDAPNGVNANLDLCVYPSIEVTADDEYDFYREGKYIKVLKDNKVVLETVEHT
ncbi:MAG: hypothetical protein J6B23_08545, partial [Clostridia bacterium]|nr:hypothetical protein [Clostridia bacterium]